MTTLDLQKYDWDTLADDLKGSAEASVEIMQWSQMQNGLLVLFGHQKDHLSGLRGLGLIR